MRIALLLILVVVLGVALAAYLRISMVSHDPDVWHVDPVTETRCQSPNCFLVLPEDNSDQKVDGYAPVYGERAFDMATAFHEFAMSQRGVERVGGRPEELHMTYVQRTPRLGFPDYFSIRFIDLPKGYSTVAIYSRSRFGYGDLGVNAARVKAWMGGVESFEVAPPMFIDEQ